MHQYADRVRRRIEIALGLSQNSEPGTGGLVVHQPMLGSNQAGISSLCFLTIRGALTCSS